MILMRSAFLLLLLTLSGCVTQQGLVDNGKIYKGISKSEIFTLSGFANQFQHPFAITATRQYDSATEVEIISPYDKSIFYVFEGVTTPSQPALTTVHAGNGRLHSWHTNMAAARTAAISLMKRINSGKSGKTP
jgi:hypothetical protein|tara:strand:- start:27 stop:425 length:399 start_codon:yes stop_codon:yes gene_type:complete